MKFLHTADWQIGMKVKHVGRAAEQVRAARLEAVERLIGLAGENDAEFILVAGDVFEDNGVDRFLILKVVQILGGAGRPVLMIPGNHDPFVPGSVWHHPAWASVSNIRLLTEGKQVEFENAIIYPCPVRDKFSAKDPTAWIPAETSNRVRIGVAHGNVEGLPQAEQDHPIPRNAAERAKLDYLALGHWHSTATYADADGSVRMAYSGTPEPSCFGERDSGNVLLVDIDQAGAPPQISAVHTGKLRWESQVREIREKSDMAAIRTEIEACPGSGDLLLSLELHGVLYADNYEELHRLEEILEARPLFGRLDASRLVPAPQDRAWIDDLPPGYMREAAERLLNMSMSGGGDAPVASRALLELFVMIQEARR
ncbi:MAG TPA: DNA repair exonuclease [Candidatus Aminicenantes bacterium]|mgnify:CR=1 FL=1|nr:DNA repair exonuclease [Candidatus Aminicenantes bacterium]